MVVVPRTRCRIRAAFVAAAVLLAAAACGSGAMAPPPSAAQASGSASEPDARLVQKLTGVVSGAGAMVQLNALQKIADEHGGNRAGGTAGFEATVDYTAGVLRAAGFEVSTPTYVMAGGEDVPPGTGRNVIAQTRTGDPDHVVMVGAHLDSVPAGPGIVDDGSGVASLLEIAARLGSSPEVKNAVRFGFFGNEETGSQGSTWYVQSLSPVDRKKIMLYLNVDMVASPNAGYFVQGGKGNDDKSAGPVGSATVGRELADQLAGTGVQPEIIEFVGDDESPFIDVGIPVGGAENGDRKRKTAEQAKIWGGEAGQRYDRCYHAACDRIDNVNPDALDHYLRAIAGTVAHFATSIDELQR
jgi:aminopeptidase S